MVVRRAGLKCPSCVSEASAELRFPRKEIFARAGTFSEGKRYPRSL